MGPIPSDFIYIPFFTLTNCSSNTEYSPQEPSKASNLNMQLEMAKCIIPKRMFDNNPLLKVSMQVYLLVYCVLGSLVFHVHVRLPFLFFIASCTVR